MVGRLKRHITIFAGAGASCFAALPTVNAFFKAVDWPDGAGYEAACKELARELSMAESSEAHKLWPQYDSEKIVGTLDLMARAGRRSVQIPRPSTEINVANTLGHLKREIVRIYGSRPDDDIMKKSPYRALIELCDSVSPPGEPIRIFTTNYDAVIERSLEMIVSSGLKSRRTVRYCTGFSDGRPGVWRPDLFSARPASKERAIHVHKLHGSATWKLDDDGRPVETGFGKPTDFDCVLYFGYKAVPESDPFTHSHDELKRALIDAGVVIILGYRFGDPFIRELFDFAFCANKHLRMLCCLKSDPGPTSAIGKRIDRYGNRIRILHDEAGKPIPFGDPALAVCLRRTLIGTKGVAAAVSGG